MEISRTLLRTMLREFWSWNNNDTCETATVMFLRNVGLSNDEIKKWLDIDPKSINMNEAEEILCEALKDTNNYYEEE